MSASDLLSVGIARVSPADRTLGGRYSRLSRFSIRVAAEHVLYCTKGQFKIFDSDVILGATNLEIARSANFATCRSGGTLSPLRKLE